MRIVPAKSPQPIDWRVANRPRALLCATGVSGLHPIGMPRLRSPEEGDEVAGLSMGGMQAFQITLHHLDLFSYIGGFSGAGGMLVLGDRKLDPSKDYNGVFADSAKFGKRVVLSWLGVGTAEPERMRTGLQRLHNSLTEASIQHVFYESPGTDHE